MNIISRIYERHPLSVTVSLKTRTGDEVKSDVKLSKDTHEDLFECMIALIGTENVLE